jgi:hypothetical protein
MGDRQTASIGGAGKNISMNIIKRDSIMSFARPFCEARIGSQRWTDRGSSRKAYRKNRVCV